MADDIATQYAERAAAEAKAKFLHQFGAIKARCESPIEEVMAAELLLTFGADSYPPAFFFAGNYTWPDTTAASFDGLFFWFQAAVGDYRADCLIQLVLGERRRFVVIECDGHDFHERTKEQAARDKQRDRWMTAQHITVVRFTGSEIWRDPARCVGEVEHVIGRLYEQM